MRVLTCLRTWLWRWCGRWLLVLSFRERIAGSKCVCARSQVSSSELLRQFGEYRQFDCDLSLVDHIHKWRIHVFHHFMCLCIFCFARAPGCVVDAAFGCWVCVFGDGLQEVSDFDTVASLRIASLCHAGHWTATWMHLLLSTHIHTWRMRVTHHFLCLCVFCFARTPDCGVDAAFDCWVSVFSGTDCRSWVILHVCRLSVERCCVM